MPYLYIIKIHDKCCFWRFFFDSLRFDCRTHMDGAPLWTLRFSVCDRDTRTLAIPRFDCANGDRKSARLRPCENIAEKPTHMHTHTHTCVYESHHNIRVCACVCVELLLCVCAKSANAVACKYLNARSKYIIRTRLHTWANVHVCVAMLI